MDKTAARHLSAIEAGAVAKTNIIGIRKILNHVARIRNGYSGNRSNATESDADALCNAIWRKRPRVTGELHDSGVRLLRSPRYAKRLADVADIIADLSHFELVSFPHYDSGYFYTAPIYRAVSRGGRGFNFRNLPWQAVAFSSGDDLTSGPVILPESVSRDSYGGVAVLRSDAEKAAAADLATCGACGLSWDDGIATGMTPVPAGRCPFEAFHPESE